LARGMLGAYSAAFRVGDIFLTERLR